METTNKSNNSLDAFMLSTQRMQDMQSRDEYLEKRFDATVQYAKDHFFREGRGVVFNCLLIYHLSIRGKGLDGSNSTLSA
jgi:hypothetical protein